MVRDQRRVLNALAFVSVYELLALRRNGERVGAMRRGGRGIRRGYGEVVHTTLDGVHARERGVVRHHVAGKGGASGRASRLVGPFRGTLGNRNVAESVADFAAEHISAASRARVGAMRHLVGRHHACCADVILATAQGIAHGIGGRACRIC